MVRPSGRPNDLILGQQWAITRRTLTVAGGFVVASTILEYLLLLTKFENNFIETLHHVLLLDGYLPSWEATGAVFVLCLAALHAYLNEGYLPSVLLGWSPVYGNVIWTIGSLSGVENYYLDPVAAFERTFPEAVVLATLGFMVGVTLRLIRKRKQSDSESRSETAVVQSKG